MNRPILHFAHANGFPARVYSRLFEGLKDRYEIVHIDRLAHNPEFPVKNGWRNQGDEIIDFLDKTVDAPVIGVGHSFGASSTFIAAVKRPDLFHGIIMLDPVVMNGFRGFMTSILKKLKLVDRITPARHSGNRRRHWPDLETAEEYFRSKGLFKDFHEDCLRDFLRYGLEKTVDGYELYFKVENEMAVYRGVPTHFDGLKGKLRHIPGVIIAGDQTNVAFDDIINRLAKQQNFEIKIIKGRHMFPLEQPDLTIQLINQYARSFC
ncbi:MAG: alpha/beta hydrolase [Bacteroidetes bacterium]|nr:alpha/beta hydrolase [Bacteroidota bacterium]